MRSFGGEGSIYQYAVDPMWLWNSPMKRVFSAVWLLFLLLTATAWANEEARARSVIDALLDWNIPLAEERLSAWERSGESAAHSLVLYRALIAVAHADYTPSLDTAKYDKPLAQLQHAILRSEAYLEEYPDDFSARLVRATAQAVSGRLMMEQGHWLKSWQMGKASRNAMRQLLEERPDFADGFLIMGMFEYFTGTVPGILRWLVVLMDFSGDRALGIDYLERCLASARVAAPQAADALLLEVDYADGEACRYVPLGRLMVKTYPRNPRYPAALRRLVAQCDRAEPDSRLVPAAFTLAAPAR
jgi:hypothetical protein